MKAAVGLRLEELRQHRALLVERAELQRGELGRVFEDLERPFRLVNLALMATSWIRSNPAVAGASAATVAVVIGKLRRWIGHAMMAWELFKVIQRHLPGQREADVNGMPT